MGDSALRNGRRRVTMKSKWFRSEPALLDDAVITFMAEYLTYRLGRVQRIVDLWADSGHMLAPLSMRLEAETAVGLCGSQLVQQSLTMRRSRHEVVDYKVANPAGPQFDLPSGIDLVVGMPAWHWAPELIDVTDPIGAVVTLTEDPANVAMIQACRCLTAEGLGAFVVGPGLLMRPGPGTLMPNLERLGLHIDGIVELPHGAIKPDHGAIQALLILSQLKRVPLIGSMTLGENSFAEVFGTESTTS